VISSLDAERHSEHFWSVTLTDSEIFDFFCKLLLFFGNCIKIFKMLYLGHFLGYIDRKNLKMFALNHLFTWF